MRWLSAGFSNKLPFMTMADMRKGECALCGHGEVLCAEALEFGARGTSRPMGVAYGGKDGMMGFQPRLDDVRGALKSYTCRSCGFTQWFADAPGEIPADANTRTKVIRSKS